MLTVLPSFAIFTEDALKAEILLQQQKLQQQKLDFLPAIC